jgi:TrmH family RNA methyltransferase
MEKITSLQNIKIKNAVKLHKASERKAQNLIIVEGSREISQAIKNGFKGQHLFICNDIISKEFKRNIEIEKYFDYKYEISPEVFEKISYREGTEGYVAIFKPKFKSLEEIKLKENPLIIVLESVEKPGNLGAILRTAEAADIDLLISCDPLTDFYNPNVIRASLGCVFKVPVAACSSELAINWLKKNKIITYAASLNAKKIYTQFDYTGPTAFVMGTEATGLSDKWISATDNEIIIPMLGSHDSLNVATAAAILIYECLRQRNFYLH